ncbi:hypothetical protein CCACVL1_13271 [Corchorus capsularis]|uniref:Uncharacterized protein n=1 Tax=Corchorus capsularis TaxID=210143 RepID=A0A1R3IBN2_COCAP|nr:hypothetical protein CCACVL1_13271 [Corchorus capsularis]
MEGQPSAGGNMLQGWAYCCPDLQGSMQLRPEEKTCMLQLPSASGLVENESQESLIIEDDVTNYAEQADQHTGANSGFPAISAMLLKQTNENEVAGPENPVTPWDCDQISDAQPLYDLTHQSLSFPESSEPDESQEQEMAERIYQLQKQRLKLKCKLLEFEKQRYKWQHDSCELDLEVDNMRLQNKCLRLGNDFLAMRLKRRKMDLDRS